MLSYLYIAIYSDPRALQLHSIDGFANIVLTTYDPISFPWFSHNCIVIVTKLTGLPSVLSAYKFYRVRYKCTLFPSTWLKGRKSSLSEKSAPNELPIHISTLDLSFSLFFFKFSLFSFCITLLVPNAKKGSGQS